MGNLTLEPPHSTSDRKHKISEEQAQWIAEFNVLMTLGNALYISEVRYCPGTGTWCAVVSHGKTQQRVGEFQIPDQEEAPVEWLPDSINGQER